MPSIGDAGGLDKGVEEAGVVGDLVEPPPKKTVTSHTSSRAPEGRDLMGDRPCRRSAMLGGSPQNRAGPLGEMMATRGVVEMVVGSIMPQMCKSWFTHLGRGETVVMDLLKKWLWFRTSTPAVAPSSMKAQKQGETMRINATRTPLPPVRTMTASQLKIGDLVAGHTADGSYPFHVEGPDRLAEISHASGLTDEQHPGIESVHAPDEPVITLSRHFGVCSECGRLSPCPDELAERRLEKLWQGEAEEAVHTSA
ncbi:hypothetical protein TICEST70_11423 [Cutibacterium acnes PRP-38]|nr:hypothetical protein TICEST70_11423 [Cutibacterium acnes PRP-38]